MRNVYLLISIVVFVPVAANLYAFAKLSPMYAALEDQDVAGSLRHFAAKVDAGELSTEQISTRLKRIAGGEDKISRGLSQLKVGAYYWILAVFLIAVLQVYLIHCLVKTHNKRL